MQVVRRQRRGMVIDMNTFYVRKTTYDSARPYEVVCLGSRGSVRIMERCATQKQAMRRVRVFKARA